MCHDGIVALLEYTTGSNLTPHHPKTIHIPEINCYFLNISSMLPVS